MVIFNRHVKNHSDKILKKKIVVLASLKEVWDAWTTTRGVKSFFSSQAKVELVIGGVYEIYFDLKAPYGSKGLRDVKSQVFFRGRCSPSNGTLHPISESYAGSIPE